MLGASPNPPRFHPVTAVNSGHSWSLGLGRGPSAAGSLADETVEANDDGAVHYGGRQAELRKLPLVAPAIVARENVSEVLGRAMEAGEGILRLMPTWVPRSFLQPGKRLRLAADDYYPYGTDRGGIDERWFASTTEAANEGRVGDEGLSYITFEGQRILLRDAVTEAGVDLIGGGIFDEFGRWPVYAKFFDNLGPIPHHMHQGFEDAKLVGREAKPEAYYFPPQYNHTDNNFPFTFLGLTPGTTKEQVRQCLERWDEGDNGILDLSTAYPLERGTGWLIPPGVLHGPGSLLTYEPQWGSDVMAVFQSQVEGRDVPRSLLVKDIPEEKHQDLDFIVGQLDWERNVDPDFKDHHYLEPIVDLDSSGDGYNDRWIVYGTIGGKQLFSAKELTVDPGARCVLKDPGASGWITTQGIGRIGPLDLRTPAMIRFGEKTDDEVFITASAAEAEVEIENVGAEPLVGLRYFGPGVHENWPPPSA